MPKRGLIVLVLVWCALLFLPVFAPQTQRMRAPLSEIDVWPYRSQMGLQELARLTRKEPDNILLAYWNERAQYRNDNADYWGNLDAFVARAPKNLTLRRAKLVAAANLPLTRQVYSPQDLYSSTKGMQEKYKPQQRLTVNGQAREGAVQAPNDGFFLWTEAMALWDRNDEPSLRALQRAARASEFNDGVMDDLRALLAWQEKQQPLQWDEKLAATYASSTTHLARMRNLQREVIWSGITHYRRGDKVGAYRRWRIALEAAGAFRRAYQSGSHAGFIGLLVAESLQREVWNTVAQELNPLAPNNVPKGWQLGAFEELARRDGQGALADFAASEQANFQSNKINPSGNMTAYDKNLGVGVASVRLTLQLPWLSRNIFWLGIIGGLGLMICLAWRRFSERFFGTVAVSQIAFFGALWLGALSLAAWVRVGPEAKTLFAIFSEDHTSEAPLSWLIEIFDKPAFFWGAVAATILISMVLDYGQTTKEDRRLQKQVLRNHKTAARSMALPMSTTIVWLVSFCLALLFLSARNSSDNAIFQVTWGALTMLALVLTLVQIERSVALDKRRRRLVFLSAICALTAFGLSATFGIKDNNPTAVASSILILCALAILLYLGIISPNWRPQFARATATALQTLGGVAVLCTVALLIASMVALPIRTQQNRIVDDYIARGEIDWMRSQLEISKAKPQP